jgi:hypothetical protein
MTKGGISERQRLLTLTHQLHPDYDETQYKVKSGLRKSFVSGTSSENLKALNTAASHLNLLDKSADELNNFGSPLVNSVANPLSEHLLGNSKITKFKTDATALVNEVANVFKKTGATDKEIEQVQASINPNMSPSQMKAAFGELAKLMRGRIGALQSQYETGMGKPADFHMINPEAQKTFDKFAPQEGGGISAPSQDAPAQPSLEDRILADPEASPDERAWATRRKGGQ